MVETAFLGIKAAVLMIVVEALLRVAHRALRGPYHVAIAVAAFIAIFFFAAPFPLIILPVLRCSASCCRAFHLLPRPRRSRNLPFCCRARCKRQRFGSRFGSCRSFCSRRFSAAHT
jgi:chromate transport protein ChrA